MALPDENKVREFYEGVNEYYREQEFNEAIDRLRSEKSDLEASLADMAARLRDAQNQMRCAHERLMNCVEHFDSDIYGTAEEVANELLDCVRVTNGGHNK